MPELHKDTWILLLENIQKLNLPMLSVVAWIRKYKLSLTKSIVCAAFKWYLHQVDITLNVCFIKS